MIILVSILASLLTCTCLFFHTRKPDTEETAIVFDHLGNASMMFVGRPLDEAEPINFHPLPEVGPGGAVFIN
jgi:hypothetical protein